MDVAAQEVSYADPSSKIDTGLQQFHPSHSSNIMLQKDATVASRQSNGRSLVFSKKPLAIGERLIIEFKTLPTHFSSVMVVGLTLEQPNASALLHSLDSLVTVGPPYFQRECNFLTDGQLLRPTRSIPTVDSEEVEAFVRIVIMYVRINNDPQKARLHVILNGWEIGPLQPAIQLQENFVALFFLEPITEVRIIQSQGVSSLQNACRNVIREQYTVDEIMQMALPKFIKLFLTNPDY